MIRALYEIGKYICEKEGIDPLTLSLREQFQNFRITKEVCIKLEEKHGEVKYIEVEKPKEIDSENSGKYGVMQTEKRGSNLILFYIFQGKDAKKIHQNRKNSTGNEVANIIVGFEDNILNFFDEDSIYKSILNENYENISNTLLNIDFSSENDEKYLLTIKIDGKYPNEIEEFTKILSDRFFEKNIDKSNGISYSEEKKCAICLNEKKLVGFFNLNPNFAFYNFAKNIFSRNYDNANAFKNNGVCGECANFINFGSHFINNNLRFSDKIIGKEKKEFFVFPSIELNEKSGDLDLLFSAIKKYKQDSAISVKNKDNIEMWEDIISDISQNIQFNLFFISYDPTKQSREITKSIREVLPSRMRKVLHINKEIEDALKKQSRNENKHLYPLKIIWDIIIQKDFNTTESIKNYQYTEYLNFIAPIFSENEKISYRLFQSLYNKYLTEVMQKYDKANYPESKILDVFYLNLFLLEINIFYDKEDKKMDFDTCEKQFYSEYSNARFIEQYWKQFKEYPDFFNSNEKCFAFLMGKLTAETRYVRGGKGSFLDGWLSNFSTNIYKLPQLMERCIETLSIENELLKRQNSILAIISFFSKIISIEKLEENKDSLIFPFVSGFSFYNKILLEKIEKKKFEDDVLGKLSNKEDKEFILKYYQIDSDGKNYLLIKNITQDIKEKILDLI